MIVLPLEITETELPLLSSSGHRTHAAGQQRPSIPWEIEGAVLWAVQGGRVCAHPVCPPMASLQLYGELNGLGICLPRKNP